jgi:hypothetical protein
MSRYLIDASLVFFIALGLIMQSQAADGTESLQSNPFSQPLVEEKIPEKPQDAADLFELRGIMVAGSSSQANIGGVILSIGEEVEGHELVSVDQQHVVLVKNGVKKVLVMNVDKRDSGNE